MADAKEIKKGTHDYTSAEDWVKPKEQAVLDKLEWFRDQKFALMMHFGIYSQMGIIESWPLVESESSWSWELLNLEKKDAPAFRKQYFAMNKSFNPVFLDSAEWASFAKKNGFRYMILTTKHHDGFCLWDTKQTDYKVTAPDCPYSASPKADIIRDVYTAFRKEGLGITAYFSKPDFHHEGFWEPGYIDGETDRYPSYDPEEKPELWEKYVQFTHKQLLELVEEYGPVDTLWLDGGWVDKRLGYDIRLGEVVERARKTTPGLIVVDRTCGGEYENYITPEQTVPAEPLTVPWEACITITDAFAYRYDAPCKSAKTILKMLVEIVAKGGNLALNIAPQPNGRLPKNAIAEMEKVGDWLSRCGDAIYGTRICAPYRTEHLAFTKKADTVYAITLSDELPEVLFIDCEKQVSSVTLLNTDTSIPFRTVEGGIEVDSKDLACSDDFKAFRLL